MIGVAIPAHDEEAHIAATLAAVRVAAAHPDLQGEAVRVVVVLDACADGTARLARHAGAWTLPIEARNVGTARAAGADWLLAAGARWLAFTDADTRVDARWLAAQLALQADAVCGSVAVDDWSAHGPLADRLQAHFDHHYRDADGHRHIHGANLGVSAEAYRRAGGFAPLHCSEDVALVEALARTGARIAWSALPRVWTSARPQARARGGFGDTLLAMARSLSEVLPAVPVPDVADVSPSLGARLLPSPACARAAAR
ncbi:glycosyltransferase [uncultured Pseudacidovorax sp.]|uniref:glycosyltransferase n=1 Tax=uncultured Pseudacidovorax sp. TaxID=679313 RepID=UPI0025DA69D8|nr:glycosyltransferase [uncultured Pseudacidovorax sp.]